MSHVEVQDSSSCSRINLREKRGRSNYSCVPQSFIVNEAKGNRNGRWTLDEHERFIEGVFRFGNNWKEIAKFIKTRNCPQARSHGQKFFSKLNSEDGNDLSVRSLHVKALTMNPQELSKLKRLLIEAQIRMDSANSSHIKIKINLQSEQKYEINNFYVKDLNQKEVKEEEEEEEIDVIKVTPVYANSEKQLRRDSSTFTNEIESTEKEDYFHNSGNKKYNTVNDNKNNMSQLRQVDFYDENDFMKEYINSGNLKFYIVNDNKNNMSQFRQVDFYDENDDLIKRKIKSFMKERGEISESEKSNYLKVLDNIKKSNWLDLMYQKLYKYQDEVCLSNFCKH